MIPPKQLAILEALAFYKFLTRAQFARLGIEKYNSAFSRYLIPLIKSGHIGMQDATAYGIGHLYYLRKKGAKFISLEQNIEINQINYCINKPELSSQTLFHRTHAIDCQIELFATSKRNNVEVFFYDRDIETLGNTRRDNNLIRKTRVPIYNNKFLEPDAIFMLGTSKGKKLFCLEYEHKDYTKKSYEKALKHVCALNLKSPSKIYAHTKAHRTLFIYKNPATMKSVMEQLNENINGIENWFLFKTYNQVKSSGKFEKSIYRNGERKNFFESWSKSNGEEESLY